MYINVSMYLKACGLVIYVVASIFVFLLLVHSHFIRQIPSRQANMFASHEASLTHKEIVFINIKIADSFFFVYGMFWLGKSFFFERGLADWKLYYKVRNMVWLKRKQTGACRAINMALAYTFAAILIDGPKRIPLLRRAICDGWSGRLGKM